MSELLSVRQAQERILSGFVPLEPETVDLTAAYGRVLTAPLHAPQDVPSFDNSSMDGFAVRSGDVACASQATPIGLEVIEDIPAGAVPRIPIGPGQASRIMTGAPLPAGADAVVPVEDTHLRTNLEGPPPAQILVLNPAVPGQFIRTLGQDLHAGQVILPGAARLRPQDVGMLASLGLDRVAVHRKPRVGLFSSGDELAAPGTTRQPGQIYDSNQYFLYGLFAAEGAEVVRLGTARDTPADIQRLLYQALEARVDLIVTSGGVSVGAYDYIRQVILANGQIDFWRINMRPGKPLAFGAFHGIPLVGLPGNPVSAFATSVVFILPLLRKLSGCANLDGPRVRAVLAESIQSDGRESYLRATISFQDSHWVARCSQHQGSGNLYSLVDANALLIVPSEVKSLPAGSEVDALLIGGELL